MAGKKKAKKKMAKKTVKKSVKKTGNKKVTKKKTKAKAAKSWGKKMGWGSSKKANASYAKAVVVVPEERLLGEVTHFYGGIGVAIVACKDKLTKGMNVHFKGATTDFSQVIDSLQYEHKDIEVADKGQEVGIKIKDKVREGDQLFEPLS